MLSNAAETVLLQQKTQAELSELQETVCRWLVYSKLVPEHPINYEVLHTLLVKLDALFKPGLLKKYEVRLGLLS